jgi:cob(I)alamin adenosyltransferase
VGHRLSKIYTRTGDQGTTGLADGSRIAKHDRRVQAVGDIDETNSAIGVVLAEDLADAELRTLLLGVQHDLFEIGAELAMPEYSGIDTESVTDLEKALDRINAELPPLKEFILPGGNRAAAACHLARSISRRAERSAWALAETDPINQDLLKYLNRLSDLLFVAARALARSGGGDEVLWQRN